MRAGEVRDTGALLGRVGSEVTELARGVHRGVAGRVFGLLGAPARPVQRLHDGICAIAYSATRIGTSIVPALVGTAAAAVHDRAAPSAHDSPGRFTLAAVSGLIGDQLADEYPTLAPQLRMRTHEGPLRRSPGDVIEDLAPAATGRIVIFLHGLCGNDWYWQLGAERSFGAARTTFGSLLPEERGWTPLYASYNTGLHISANGRALATLLEDLTAAWPVGVERIALIGHSMGALVARSAAQQGAKASHVWTRQLRDVVALGGPHLGAPLERLANWGSHRLGRLPETRPFATLLNRRSVGIKDLRYGAVIDDDWVGFDPDELLCDRCTPARLPPGIAYYAVAATLTRSPHGPFPMIGDLLVEYSSATGAGPLRRIPFEVTRTMHIGRRHHLHLLSDPIVYAQLRTWLA
jgi:pimeloyl-ACP methyl ester carboxylesterase